MPAPPMPPQTPAPSAGPRFTRRSLLAAALLALVLAEVTFAWSASGLLGAYRVETPPALRVADDWDPAANMTLAVNESDGFAFRLTGLHTYPMRAEPNLEVEIARLQPGGTHILPTEAVVSAKHNRTLDATLALDGTYPPGTLLPVIHRDACQNDARAWDCLEMQIYCCVEVDEHRTRIRVNLTYDLVKPLPVGAWRVDQGYVTLVADVTVHGADD